RPVALVLLQRPHHRLRREHVGECQPEQADPAKNEQRVHHADARQVPGRRAVLLLRRPQEADGADERAELPRRAGEAVARRPEARREELRRQDEGGGVRPEVGGEEGERVEHDVAGVRAVVAPVSVVRTREREEEDGHEEEPGHLEAPPADAVDEEHGDEVARDGGGDGDDGLELGHVERLLERVDEPRRREQRPVDLRLEQRAAVVGDVEEEPRRRAREQVPPVLPDEAPREEAVRRARRRRRPAQRRRHLLLGDGAQVEVGQNAADVVGGLHHVALHQSRISAL
ncbi:Os06g0325350, partial [Oryza sativa Japonica Group]